MALVEATPVFVTEEYSEIRVPADGTTEVLLTPVDTDAPIRVYFIDEENNQEVQVLSDTVPDGEARITFDTPGRYVAELEIGDVDGVLTMWRKEVNVV